MESSVVEVLRAKELQRLRRLRQLGLAHLVYPGAEHSRLVHSLGAAYLATRFGRHLGQVGREFLSPLLTTGSTSVRDLALAALCHDLGHGPLSHIWERHIIGEDFNRDLWISSLGLDSTNRALFQLKWHELVGQALLAWKDGELYQLLEQQEAASTARICHLLLGTYHPGYLPRLLHSDVDIDRCDYILRDAHQTGVAYGRCDINWLISTLTLGITRDNRLVVGFDKRKGPAVIEQVLVARRALYYTVYFHKTVRAAECMLGLFLKRLRDIPRIFDHAKVRIPLLAPYAKVLRGEGLHPSEVLALDDYTLWTLTQLIATSHDSDPTATDLARRIMARDLFKQVPCQKERLEAFVIREDAYQLLHKEVQPYCQGDASYYVYIDNPDFKMFSDDEQHQAYFVDIESPGRVATPIQEHESIRRHWSGLEKFPRLFVPREAVESVCKLINSPHSTWQVWI
jgi:HD superfamily phosphohydrolase